MDSNWYDSKRVHITIGGSNRKRQRDAALLKANNIEFRSWGAVSIGSKRIVVEIRESDLEKALELGFSKSRRQPLS